MSAVVGFRPAGVGGDDPNGDLGVIGGDDGFLAPGVVLLGIQLDAQEFQTLADARAHGSGVLAHAGGEHQAVQSAQSGGVGADVLADFVGKLVQRQSAVLVAFLSAVLDIAEVGGHAGQRQHAGLLVQHVQALVGAHAVLVHNELHDGGVDVAGTIFKTNRNTNQSL